VPLTGDALFFRAAATLDARPERAAKDFQTLLRQRAWVDAECRAGGRRLLFAGDALLRLGRADAARRAYEQAGEPSSPELAERRAVAEVCRELVAGLLSASTREVALMPAVSVATAIVGSGVPPRGEVLIAEGDFTSVFYPFLAAAERGRLRVREAPLHAMADADPQRQHHRHNYPEADRTGHDERNADPQHQGSQSHPFEFMENSAQRSSLPVEYRCHPG